MKYYSYGYVRIFVDQLAIAVFACSVALGVAAVSEALTIASSVFSVFFLLFMVAGLTFKQGVADKEKTDLGRFKRNDLTGLYMGLIASVPNILLAIAYAVLCLFPALQNYAGVVCLIMKLIHGEYLGLLTIKVGGTMLSSFPICYFIMVIPTMLAAFLGYFFAVRGIIVPKPQKKDLE